MITIRISNHSFCFCLIHRSTDNVGDDMARERSTYKRGGEVSWLSVRRGRFAWLDCRSSSALWNMR